MGAATILLDVYTHISILYGFTHLQNTLIQACCLATNTCVCLTGGENCMSELSYILKTACGRG